MTRMQPTLYRIAAILMVGAIALGTIAVVGCGGGGGEDGTFGEVRGRVLDNDGNPLDGARVTCGGSSARTEADGDFRISNARSGNQAVSASLGGYYDAGGATKQVNVPPNGSVNAGNLYLVQMTQNHEYIWLSDLSSTTYDNIESSEERTVHLGGDEYLNGWMWWIEPGINWGIDSTQYLGFARYSLSRRYSRIEGIVGVDTRGECSNTLVTVVFIADGDEIWRSPKMKLGDVTTIDVDLTDVSVFEIQWHWDESSPKCYDFGLGWADLRLKVAN